MLSISEEVINSRKSSFSSKCTSS